MGEESVNLLITLCMVYADIYLNILFWYNLTVVGVVRWLLVMLVQWLTVVGCC